MFNFVVAKPDKKPECNTYCMYRPKRLGGAICFNAIPLTETICGDCKQEKFPRVICHVCNPPVEVPGDQYEQHRKEHSIRARMGTA